MVRMGNISIETDVPARMRDGTILFADIYRPQGSGPFPVILLRQPYDKTQAETFGYAHPFWYAQQGYMVVSQDTRGRWKSQGEFYPFRDEMTDGYDSVEWAAGLPGSNGRVGLYGFSYGGATQLMAAVMQPPHLTCMCPGFTGSQFYEGWAYNGGAFALAFNMSWAHFLALDIAKRRGLTDLQQDLCKAVMGGVVGHYTHMPLSRFPGLQRDDIAPYFFDWINHPTYDDYWKQWSIDERYDRIAVPALHFGGWYDIFVNGTLKNFCGIQERGANATSRNNQMLVVGPWYHDPWDRIIGQMDFGEEAGNIVDDMQLRWFDYWLKGRDNALMAEPSVRVFIMGENRWRYEDRWPPKGMRFVEHYLHSKGRANSLNGDGILDHDPPGDEPPDVYTDDPHTPLPSLGGHSCCNPAVAPIGPADQRLLEAFNQVLVYTSEPLKEDLTLIGPVTARLWVASSAVDADFVVKLVDVHPCGKAINLTEGILRARYRASLEHPSLLKPYEVYQIEIRVGNTCAVFKAGHRIRVDICSASFPTWDRNTNSGNVPATDDYSKIETAMHVVFHDAERASRVILPVVR